MYISLCSWDHLLRAHRSWTDCLITKLALTLNLPTVMRKCPDGNAALKALIASENASSASMSLDSFIQHHPWLKQASKRKEPMRMNKKLQIGLG